MISYKPVNEKTTADGGTPSDVAADRDVEIRRIREANQAWQAGLKNEGMLTSQGSPTAVTVLAPTPAIKTAPVEPATAEGPAPDACEPAVAQAQVGNAATATATITSAVESEAIADAAMHDETAHAQQPRNALQAGLTRATEQPAAKTPKGKPAARRKRSVLSMRNNDPPPSVAGDAISSETASTPAGMGEQPVGTQGVGLGQAQGERDRSSEVVTRVDAESLPVDIGIDSGANLPDAADDTGLNTAGSEKDPAESTASADHHAPLADVEFKHVDDSSEHGVRYEMVLLDTTRLDDVASAEIAAIANSIRQHLKRVHNDIFAIGRGLLIARGKLRHGDWLPWLAAEFGWTPRSAQHYMNVAARLGDKCESLSHLGMEILYKLAAPSTPGEVVAAVTSMAEVGKKVTLPDVTRLIHEFKPKEPGKTAVANVPSRSTTEEAFALLSQTLEPDRLQRLGHLLGRCDIVKLVAMINRYDPSEEHVAA